MQPELDDLATPAEPAARPTRAARRRRDQKGQILVIFAGAMIALVALCAVVVDVAWYWTSNLKMQRAADAAALAGVVWLPGNQGQASIAARNEAAKNGYTDGVGGVTVTPIFDLTNPRRLKVSVSGPVGTLFARAVGINSWPAARTAKADYVLPVPMGSPQNYYGVGFYEGLVTNTVNASGYTPCGTATWDATCTGSVATAAPTGGQWTPSSGTIQASINSDNNIYATENTNGEKQQFSTFGLLSGGSAIPTPGTGQVLTIAGLEVRLTDAFVSVSCSNSTIGVQTVMGRRHDLVDGRRDPEPRHEHPQRRLHAGQQHDHQRVGRPHLEPQRLQRHQLPRPADGQQGLRHLGHHARPRHARGPRLVVDGDDDDDQADAQRQRPGQRHAARLPGLLGRDVHLRRLPRERRQVRPEVPRQRHRPAAELAQPDLQRERLRLHDRAARRIR